MTEPDRYFTPEELAGMGFKHIGRDVHIARTARLYAPAYMSIGDRCIIDDYCVVSGAIEMGDNVHLAHACTVVAGREGIVFGDYSGLAFNVCLFAQSDDYTGAALTNPTVPMALRRIRRGRITLGRHVIVGTRAVVFPGVDLAEGCAVGAMSVVMRATEPWSIYSGNPATRLRSRKKEVLALEARHRAEFLNLQDTAHASRPS